MWPPQYPTDDHDIHAGGRTHLEDLAHMARDVCEDPDVCAGPGARSARSRDRLSGKPPAHRRTRLAGSGKRLPIRSRGARRMADRTHRLTVTHEHGERVRVAAGGVEIACYEYAPDAPAFEGPKPYLHPVRTLSGGLVTGYRPNDHRWHKGIQMTWTDVSGQNFWGGNTYVHGTGYVPLDNVGSIRHDAFAVIDLTPEDLTLDEELSWLTSTGETWIAERRRLRVHGVDVERGTWVLDAVIELRNVRDAELRLGSPTTNGRPNAGYTGFFWRGPRAFTGGGIHTPGRGGPGTMGTSSPR